MKRVNGVTPPGLLNIILADDDNDDRILFEEALKEIPIPTNIICVTNGVQLMELLATENRQPYDVIFLDLNMPKKNGFTCLEEIKSSASFKQLPVIILSTSQHTDIVERLYENGAAFFIRKPTSFMQLINVLQKATTLIAKRIIGTTRADFIICSNPE